MHFIDQDFINIMPVAARFPSGMTKQKIISSIESYVLADNKATTLIETLYVLTVNNSC